MTRFLLALLLVSLAFGCVEGRKDTPLVRGTAQVRDRSEGGTNRTSNPSASSEKP